MLGGFIEVHTQHENSKAEAMRSRGRRRKFPSSVAGPHGEELAKIFHCVCVSCWRRSAVRGSSRRRRDELRAVELRERTYRGRCQRRVSAFTFASQAPSSERRQVGKSRSEVCAGRPPISFALPSKLPALNNARSAFFC